MIDVSLSWSVSQPRSFLMVVTLLCLPLSWLTCRVPLNKDGFECIDSGLLMRVPYDAAIFHGWSYQTLVDFTSDRRSGSTREIRTNHVEHSDTLISSPVCLLFPVQVIIQLYA